VRDGDRDRVVYHARRCAAEHTEPDVQRGGHHRLRKADLRQVGDDVDDARGRFGRVLGADRLLRAIDAEDSSAIRSGSTRMSDRRRASSKASAPGGAAGDRKRRSNRIAARMAEAPAGPGSAHILSVSGRRVLPGCHSSRARNDASRNPGRLSRRCRRAFSNRTGAAVSRWRRPSRRRRYRARIARSCPRTCSPVSAPAGHTPPSAQVWRGSRSASSTPWQLTGTSKPKCGSLRNCPALSDPSSAAVSSARVALIGMRLPVP
jgi:hypothetical protein